MTSRTRLFIAIYLILWTPIVATCSVSFMMASTGLGAALPFLGITGTLVAMLVAMRWSRWLVRGRDRLGWPRLLFYFAATPVMIYLTLALVISLLWLVYAPAAFATGLSLGLPALAIGTAIHLAGMLPLWLISLRQPII